MTRPSLFSPATPAEQRRNLTDWRYVRSYVRHLQQCRLDVSSWEMRNAYALLSHCEARIARAAYDIALYGHSRPVVRVAHLRVGRTLDRYAAVRVRELALAKVAA